MRHDLIIGVGPTCGKVGVFIVTVLGEHAFARRLTVLWCSGAKTIIPFNRSSSVITQYAPDCIGGWLHI